MYLFFEISTAAAHAPGIVFCHARCINAACHCCGIRAEQQAERRVFRRYGVQYQLRALVRITRLRAVRVVVLNAALALGLA